MISALIPRRQLRCCSNERLSVRSVARARAQLAELERSRSTRMVEEETLNQLANILPQWATAFRQAAPHQRKFLLNQVVERRSDVW